MVMRVELERASAGQASLPPLTPLPVSPISFAQRESARPAGWVPRHVSAVRNHVAAAGDDLFAVAARKEGWLRQSAKERWHDRPPLPLRLQKAAAVETRQGELAKPFTPSPPSLWEASDASRAGLSRTALFDRRARATRAAVEVDCERNIANNPLAGLVVPPLFSTHSHAATPPPKRAAHRVDLCKEGRDALRDHLGTGSNVDAGPRSMDERGNKALLAVNQAYTLGDHITLG